MPLNLVLRNLGPLVQALSGLRQSLYTPPRSTIAMNRDLFPDPLQPVQPLMPGPHPEPLGWPFDWGRNLIYTPRSDAEYSAADLRRFSKYPLARICIENNKDMLTRMPWRVQLKSLPGETTKEHSKRSKNDVTLKKLSDFFARPNPDQDWAEFLRPILEDMLVIDAPTIFCGRSRKSDEIVELRWLEGSSITRLVDEHGWTPLPPNPAYHQLWQGLPRIDLDLRQLVYKPRNIVPRNTSSSYIYGFSPTEQVIDEIKIGISRLQYIADFYGEGTIPGGILFAPVNTPADKIKEAQQWLDSDLAGNLAKRRRLQILQGFQKEGSNEQLHFPKEPTLADLFDEMHIRKICFAYGTSPQRLMRMINRSSAQANQDAAEKEGTLPFLNWLKGTIDWIIQSPYLFNQPEYEFAFDPFMELDSLKQAMADAEDIKIGLYTRNEKRKERGDDPRDEPDADELMVMTGQGAIKLGEQIKQQSGQGPQNSRGKTQPKAATSLRSTASTAGSTSTSKAYGNGDSDVKLNLVREALGLPVEVAEEDDGDI